MAGAGWIKGIVSGACLLQRSVLGQIFGQGSGKGAANWDPYRHLRMGDFNRDQALGSLRGKILSVNPTDWKAHKLHRADPLGIHLAQVEAGFVAALADYQEDMVFQTDQLAQVLIALRGVGEFDE